MDHPRACGENGYSAILPILGWGSPPRMRGKLPSISSGNDLTRITPAHAGKTRLHNVFFLDSEDHPRACGENPVTAAVTPLKPGSPPRMRGKLFLALIGALPQRITPAHAGKTAQTFPCRPALRGSPPRMRGKRRSADEIADDIRITPAHAGKTPWDLRTK